MIPTKWKWIQNECLERNFEKAAILAGEIDAALLEDYDPIHTPKWKEFCRTLNTDIVVFRSDFSDVVTNPAFCIACDENHAYRGNGHSRCEGCRFGARCGECSDPDSLYRQFLREVSKVWPLKEERMIQGDQIENINRRIE
ncbi:MAG: hypothetical protein IMF19_15700 [Proteobacteria bacterium]|nr:hypothetical protein [Pseudomonadota bacterium]